MLILHMRSFTFSLKSKDLARFSFLSRKNIWVCQGKLHTSDFYLEGLLAIYEINQISLLSFFTDFRFLRSLNERNPDLTDIRMRTPYAYELV